MNKHKYGFKMTAGFFTLNFNYNASKMCFFFFCNLLYTNEWTHIPYE